MKSITKNEVTCGRDYICKVRAYYGERKEEDEAQCKRLAWCGNQNEVSCIDMGMRETKLMVARG